MNIIENSLKNKKETDSSLTESDYEDLEELAIRNQIGFEEAFLNMGNDIGGIISEVAKTRNIDRRRTLTHLSSLTVS